MKKLEKTAAKAINKTILDAGYGWPPVCVGFFYQPQRPQAKPGKSKKAIKD